MSISQPLHSIATTHNATPYQIALAWLIAQPRVITIPMSFDRQHQAENLAAVEIELTSDQIGWLDINGQS